MKSLTSTLLAITLGLTARGADGFTIRGEIPGLPAGTKIELVSTDRGISDGRQNLAETTATDGGSFILKGSVASPTLSEIRIDSLPGEDLGKAITLMVENTPMTVTAAHIDSVAPGFYSGSRGRYMERNVTVTGGQAQKELNEYNEAMFPYEAASKDAHYNLYWGDERKKRSKDEEKRLAAAFKEANRAETAARRAFIAAHPAYSISGMLMLDDINSPFTYTAAELDAIGASVKDMPDTARRATVEKALGFARNYLRESSYTDFAALDTLGTERKFSEFVGNGRYVMVDFWASWCGPCRAAIPHVRELYNKYGDNLQVIAVSLDSAEKPWRKAMNEEQMEWTQLWADKAHVSGISEPYQVHSIPYIMLLNPEGRIIYAGHDPDAVSLLLEKELH